MSALKTTPTSHEHAVVVELDGEIDIATAEDFRAEITALAETPGTHAILDCERLSFIDSSGLRALIQCHKVAQQHSSQIALAAATHRVAQILHVTAIDRRIPVHATVADALRSGGSA
ncbi:STAS domain-containing protein [Lipingzhangella sp. LS1_29]|uniref:Anti-sigma factor antagonist n=1 Tax=Lipingzhangella rawalii TaxID=2055835 RepID=A0ABU2H3K3_9ACTN|nr:STAS domain-containing protein [Lipingzhangella rawalii]MDS1269887.1 STAS domain-containing protein [Lipingzhangella rawalii]